ncbi:hypothetical protein RF11_13603 [Thelohanellus kitauei]|uniref:Uncharacterized protein n=1 Tax=Thelohanellus kitauei TaxID=669202 RepID=A0A0C2ILQ8_THEKT|nr:hypothetical protein RF11_13603 [Thelohanellus kitauei]
MSSANVFQLHEKYPGYTGFSVQIGAYPVHFGEAGFQRLFPGKLGLCPVKFGFSSAKFDWKPPQKNSRAKMDWTNANLYRKPCIISCYGIIHLLVTLIETPTSIKLIQMSRLDWKHPSPDNLSFSLPEERGNLYIFTEISEDGISTTYFGIKRQQQPSGFLPAQQLFILGFKSQQIMMTY